MFQSILRKGRNRSRAGFTIFELIVVLAILGILASVLYPKMQNREAAAKIQALETEMLRLYEACEAWKANRGQTNFTGLSLDALDESGLWDNAKTNPWGGAYSIDLESVNGTNDSVEVRSGPIFGDGAEQIMESLVSRFANKNYHCGKGTDDVFFRAPY